MAYQFDPNKYKSTFDQMFGAGKYDAGIKQAQQLGAAKGNAQIAQMLFQKRLSTYESLMKKQQTAALKPKKKSYSDALNALSQPDQLKRIQTQGAYGYVNDIKNDPAAQERVKAAGYNLTDYYNAVYAAASGGKFKSERQFNQYDSQLKQQTSAAKKQRDKAAQDLGFKNESDPAYQAYLKQQNTKQQPAHSSSLLDKLGNGLKDIGSEIGTAATAAEKFFNPFDHSNKDQVVKDYINHKQTGTFQEVARGANRAVDSASLGLMSNLDKKVTGKTPYYTSTRPIGQGGVTDMITSGLGYLVPGVGAAKGLKAVGLGAKEATGLAKLGQLAKEGMFTGAALSTGEQLNNWAINPKDQNVGDSLKSIFNGAVTGAVAEPILHGIGQVVGKALGKTFSKGTTAEDIVNEIKALPAPKQKEILALPAPKPLGLPAPKQVSPMEALMSAGKKPNGLKSPIPQLPKPMKAEYVKGRMNDVWGGFGQSGKTVPKARPMYLTENVKPPVDPMNRPQQYWQKRYEDFVKYVHDNGYTDNNLSHQAINELWTHFAANDEPVNIDQVVELAYPKGFKAPPAPKQAPQPQGPTLKDYLNSDPRIKSAIKQLFPNGAQDPKISRPATLEEMVQHLADISKQGVEPQKIIPKDTKGKLELFLKGNLQMFAAEQQKVLNKLVPIVKEMLKENPKGDVEKMFLEAAKENGIDLKALLNGKGKAVEPILPGKSGKAVNIGASEKAINASPKVTDPNPADGHGHGLIDLQAEAEKAGVSPELVKEIQKIKDINQLQVGTKNIYELAAKLPKQLGDKIVTALDKAKKSNINHLEKSTNDLYDQVVKGLGIKKGSKESALVQDFGEKTLVKKYLRKRGIDPKKLSNDELNKINLQQLKKSRPNDWQKIVAADNYFRQNYNKLIDQVNGVRSKIYPNNPDKLVPKRNDYYHHFNELTGMEGVKNLFDTPANIDPHLEGISPHTKPKSKFQGFMQKRMNGTYKSDAVGGYLKYLKASSHSIHVDPVIPVLRNTAKTLADATTESRNANKIIEALQDHANDIAGKTNPYDRMIQKLTGRKAFRIVSTLNSRVKGNMILGNLSSTLGQIGNVPLGVAKAKQFSAPGLIDTLSQAADQLISKTANKSAPIYQSQFLKERFHDGLFRRFDQKLIDQPKKMAIWLMETADKSGTNFIWNSMYRKGVSKGVADPIKFADTETKNIVAGRGVGEVPLLQKSKTTQILAPFTLEVGNQWKVLSKMVGEKDAVGILTFLAASYGLNKAMETVRGSGVSYDPIGAAQEGYTRTDGNAGQKALGALASVAGETVGNIPFGNLITNQANANAKVPLTNVKLSDLLGTRNPNRFGSGLTVTKAISDPLYLLPFGASQAEKTYKGANAIKNGGVYAANGNLEFPMASGAGKDIQALTMGPNATSEARAYFNSNGKPLSSKQTAQFQQAQQQGQGKQFYDSLMLQRQQKKITDQIKKIQKDHTLSPSDKQKAIVTLMQQLQNLKK